MDRIGASRPDDVAALAAVIALVGLTASDVALPPTVDEALAALRTFPRLLVNVEGSSNWYLNLTKGQ